VSLLDLLGSKNHLPKWRLPDRSVSWMYFVPDLAALSLIAGLQTHPGSVKLKLREKSRPCAC
jgi:hypothetical protein